LDEREDRLDAGTDCGAERVGAGLDEMEPGWLRTDPEDGGDMD
jgi:hypothetical protein